MYIITKFEQISDVISAPIKRQINKETTVFLRKLTIKGFEKYRTRIDAVEKSEVDQKENLMMPIFFDLLREVWVNEEGIYLIPEGTGNDALTEVLSHDMVKDMVQSFMGLQAGTEEEVRQVEDSFRQPS